MIIIEAPSSAPTQKTEQSVPVVDNAVANAKVCAHCNKPLEYIEQYNRYYCYDCKEYAPADN
jgi:hypothetical protein